MITLKTLPQATAQEVFDQVAKHLLTQRERCTRPDSDVCQYRNDDGLMCAAGCLIGDDEYEPDWDLRVMGWGELVDSGAAPNDHAELIADLQWLHDTLDPVRDWPDALLRLAVRHNLETTVLN